MRARYYDPVTGRFVNEDPFGDGVNPYTYVDNSPVAQVDCDGRIILTGPLAVSEGLDVEAGEGTAAQAAYRYITNKIGNALGRQNARLALELLDDNPVSWSAGEYVYLREVATLLIRMNGKLPKAEIAQVFCREIAEFLERQGGGVLTRDVWTKFGPKLYRDLMGFFK